MSVSVLTLFGEETPPEELKAVGKSRALPKKQAKEAEKETPPPPVPVTEKPATKVKPAKEVKEKAAPAKKPAATTRRKKKTKEELPDTPPLLEGWVAEKQYYSIGEVSALFEVNTSHIRFWTKEFDMKVRTTRKGDRLYTPAQIKELQVIYELVKGKGYTISGAKSKLKSNKNIAVETVDLKQSLLHLRNKLLSIRNQLT